MSDHDASPRRSDPVTGRPYLRHVTIEDHSAEQPADHPVHVTNRVLFDGREYPGLVNLRMGWSVSGGLIEGTVLTLHVDAEAVEHGRVDEASHEGDRFRLAGYTVEDMPCLVPQGRYWETVHIPDPTIGEDAFPGHRSNLDEARAEWVRVHLFVREVEIVAKRDHAGDVVVDGGEPGVLATCEQCHGKGLLHVPDYKPEASTPAEDTGGDA
jgi:hypothetical protein